ncbi:ADP-ribosylglycohydrolase family protein [Thiorhodococcus mannitoliphagus]|uniref:ADP-ribosylglycohydrolase family protein n=1 Tax=Thiorhodococcus mannitoliphagus TaxID=329406 RepID=A0A6P1E3K0_9GAMM|nr:ADP-ribosylglycohydrolase family protein [Thiorhodococcus mannitoliphagus]NEX22604.1 ADP-ribosylglycohydrolase family protein [Thiorhodococcus mannitoliphagus]
MSASVPTLLERYRGALIGLAVGDALGVTLEFTQPGGFEPIDDMVGGGPFGLAPGQWTDDTSMALCLAESLIHCRGFDAADQMRRYLRWRDDGHWSSTGRCFDIGNTVAAALRRFEATHEPYAGSVDPRSAGNGSLMRLAPIPLAFAQRPVEAVRCASRMSRTTHGATEAVDACRYMTALMVGVLEGRPKSALLSPRFGSGGVDWAAHPLSAQIDQIAAGRFKARQPPEIRGTGYVVQALEAALWAFHNSSRFEVGALKAVNLGEDADTTGAIYGQLAGAYYGLAAIPESWRDLVVRADEIIEVADHLADLAGQRQ